MATLPGRRTLIPLALAVLLAAPAGAAAAEARPFYQHYEEGLALAGQGDWAAALEAFAAAAEHESRPRARIRTYGNRFLFDYDPHFHQARCLVELGRWSAAREQIAESRAAGVTAAADLDALASRAAVGERASRARAAEPEPGPPAASRPESGEMEGPSSAGRASAPARLAVATRPAGAEVMLDGRRIGRTPLAPVPVTPGRHRLRLTAEGYAAWEQTVETPAGETLRLDVTLRAPSAGEGERAGAAGAGGPEQQTGDRAGRRPAPEGDPETAGSGAGSLAAGDEGETGAGARDSAREGESGGTEVARPAPGVVEPPAPGAGATGPGAGGAAAEAAAGERGGPRSTPAGAGGSAGSAGPPRLLLALVAAALALALILAAAFRRGRRRGPHGGASGALSAAPRRIGGYRVLGELGRGGMAVTYRARRRADGPEVALKVPRESPDPTYRERFLREGKLGETLHHPGIVRIIEAAEDGGLPFLAMELIPGRTLRAELDAAPGGLPERRALEIARAIAEALDYAHGKSVVHRDLKPENIMLLPGGGLKVMDFGVARVDGQPGLTTSQIFFGSPVYAAPELVEPRTLDHRADLYSLGVLLYEMLEGEPPFVHESVFKLLEMHQSRPLPDPAALPRPLPAALYALIAHLCEKRPDRRYGSAQELLVDLDRLLYQDSHRGRDLVILTKTGRPSEGMRG